MIDGLCAVQVKTANLDKLKKFYVEKIGLTVHHSCAGCVILKLGEKQLLILQKAADAKAGVGEKAPVIFGFSTPDVAALHKKLGKAVKFASAPKDEDWGASIAAAVDPDGNSIMFIQHRPDLAKAEFCAAGKETDA